MSSKAEIAELQKQVAKAHERFSPSALISFSRDAGKEDSSFEFGPDMREFQFAGMTGRVQQLCVNPDTTVIDFTVYEGRMADHIHEKIEIEGIMVLSGTGRMRIRPFKWFPWFYYSKKLKPGVCFAHHAELKHDLDPEPSLRILVLWHPRLPTDNAKVKP